MKHVMSTRFLVVLLCLASVAGAAGSMAVQGWAQYARVGWSVQGVRPLSEPLDTETQFDLGSPFERCLAAVDGAELPGWMWECHEFEWQAR